LCRHERTDRLVLPEQVGPKLEIGDKKDDAVKACFAAVAAAIVECDYEEFWNGVLNAILSICFTPLVLSQRVQAAPLLVLELQTPFAFF